MHLQAYVIMPDRKEHFIYMEPDERHRLKGIVLNGHNKALMNTETFSELLDTAGLSKLGRFSEIKRDLHSMSLQSRYSTRSIQSTNKKGSHCSAHDNVN